MGRVVERGAPAVSGVGPTCFQEGWQHEALSHVERHHREFNVFPRFSQAELWFGHRRAQEAVWHWLRAQRAASPVWILTCSECSCSVVSSCLFFLPCVAARTCREAGGRVNTHILVRDLDLDLEDPGDARMEVVVHGLPLQGGSQLAVDTTLVSPLRGDGSARAGAGRTACPSATCRAGCGGGGPVVF